MRKAISACLLSAALAGCANPSVVQIGQDTYVLAKEDHAGIFGNMAKLKAEVIQEANNFAAQRGKIAVPVSVREKAVGSKPAEWAHFEYQFKLVDQSATSGATLNVDRRTMPDRDSATESLHNVSVNVTSTPANDDAYNQLLKLDELRKKNIITDKEFEVEKAKILKSR